jgi:phosphoglycolate phosphatase-like HAD superfamily hydrolase
MLCLLSRKVRGWRVRNLVRAVMAMNRAVLWDMDGTLVDSAEYHWQPWRDTMSREGFPVTHGQFLATFGQRNDSILREWLNGQRPELIERIGKPKKNSIGNLCARTALCCSLERYSG